MEKADEANEVTITKDSERYGETDMYRCPNDELQLAISSMMPDFISNSNRQRHAKRQVVIGHSTLCSRGQPVLTFSELSYGIVAFVLDNTSVLYDRGILDHPLRLNVALQAWL